ncbi:MAG: c-type cytochrome [Anaerolineae bacterium]
MIARPILSVILMLSLAACAAPPPAAPPSTPTAAPVVLGQEVFARVCAQCHGAQAEGHAYPPASALNGSEHTWHHPDVQLREWIKNGKLGMAQMPAYGGELTDELGAFVFGLI